MLQVPARVRAAHLKEAGYEITFTILTKQDEANLPSKAVVKRRGNRTSS